MEALLIIFAELLFACLAPLLAAIGALIALVFELFALLITMLFGGSSRKTPPAKRRDAQGTRGHPATGSTSGSSQKPLFSKKTIHWIAGGFGGVAVLAVIASFVLFDPLLRMILTTAGDRAEMSISYEESSGSLLSGRVALSGLALQRQSEDGLAFDLRVKRIEADVDLFSLFGSEPRIQFAAVDGVSGVVTPPEARDAHVEAPARPKPARRPFRADRVEVADVLVSVQPRNSEPYDLEIRAGDVAPFRSQLAMFDLLFRSNLEASVAGQPLYVATRDISEQGRETIWSFEEVEVDRLKLILPKAPLTWLSDGTVTARVEDRWDLTDDEIDMDWRITLDGIEVATPEAAGQTEAFLANGLARIVNAKGGDADFQYRLELGPEEVAALRRGDLSTFWDTVLKGFLRPKFIETSDEPATEGPGRVQTAIDALRERFRRSDAD